MRLLPLSGIAGSVIFVALAVSLGTAEAQAPAPAPRGTVVAPPPADNPAPAQPRAPRGTGAAQIPANGGRIVLEVNKGTLIRLSGPAASEVKGAQVINRMTVATPNQVNLQVRIAEVNITKLNEIGVNWQKIGASLSFLTNNPVTIMGEATNDLLVGKLPGAQATISALE